jgi:hypothetical protein
MLVGTLVAGIAAWLIGFADIVSWVADLSTSATATLTAALTLLLLLAAFVLRTLRTSILDFWSGRHRIWQWTGVGVLLAGAHEKKRRRMQEQAAIDLQWPEWLEKLSSLMSEVENGGEQPIPKDVERNFLKRIADLRERCLDFGDAGVQAAYQTLLDDVFQTTCDDYTSESMDDVLQRMSRLTNDFVSAEVQAKANANVEADLYYSTVQQVEPTVLGNVLAALDAYPFWRYRMEGGAFWTHLESYIKPPIIEQIREQRILLDFALALSTLLLIFAVLMPFGGPWLQLRYEALVGAIALGVGSAIFYKIAVSAAIGLSRALRAGCDLYRRDLLKQLSLEPANLTEERKLWESLSQLALYREPQQPIAFAPSKPPDPKPPKSEEPKD